MIWEARVPWLWISDRISLIVSDVAADRDVAPAERRLGHRVHGVHHQVHEHLLQEHLIGVDHARTRRLIDGGRDLPCGHVVRDQRQGPVDHCVQIDRFPVQLMAFEHRPMAIDDLRSAYALGLDVGQDLSDRVGRRTIRGDHHLQRLGVVHDRTERLTELMSNRAGQRRHRLAATRVSGERQVPPAVALGTLPRAPLVQEPGYQQRLDGQHADGAQDRALVCAPQARSAIAHDASWRQPAFRDAPPL